MKRRRAETVPSSRQSPEVRYDLVGGHAASKRGIVAKNRHMDRTYTPYADSDAPIAAGGRIRALRILFGVVLELRLLYPLIDSPLAHLFSDPLRHWENGLQLLHPSIMGSDDPLLYQVWLYALQHVAAGSPNMLLLGCGLLCALMPYGWYRAFRELMPVEASLVGGTLMGLVPDFLSLYGYFMTETLLLTLTGFAFWLTFRAVRRREVWAFAAACALWIAATFTRVATLPLALVSLLWIWLPQPNRALKLLVGLALAAVIAIPAGLHGRAKLHYFAPFGNLYLHQIYRDSGSRRIELEFGSEGHYWFESPSFANPTFYPFSDWVTSRTGAVNATVDLSRGRADWEREHARAVADRRLSTITDTGENLLFLAFGQSWPNNDRNTLMGWLTVWMRWIWVPLTCFVAFNFLRGTYRGPERLLPVAGLLMFLWFGLQQSGIVEGRFRVPLEPIFLAATVIAGRRLLARRRTHVDRFAAT